MNEPFTNMRSFLGALAKALNLINPELENHHERTAYLAYMIAHEAGFTEDDIKTAVYAGITHDIGAIVSETPQNINQIEHSAQQYAVMGAELMKGFPDAKEIPNIILHSQRSWREFLELNNEQQGRIYSSARIASVVHLADIVSTLLRQDKPVLEQAKDIRTYIISVRDKEFSAEAVDAFQRVSEYEYIWLDLAENPRVLEYFIGDIDTVSLDETMALTAFVSRIIDYRSPFTAMHSAGVSVSAQLLAGLVGMEEDECKMMRIAGYLHDVGKLRIPRGILEKPGKLTDKEFDMIKEHPYYTRMIVMGIDGFDKIADWAGFHHEKLNGRGYPFHFGADRLDTGSRIMAVADIFSALTEDRPYRLGMNREEAMRILKENANSNSIDGEVVALLEEHYEEINAARKEVSHIEGERYYSAIQ